MDFYDPESPTEDFEESGHSPVSKQPHQSQQQQPQLQPQYSQEPKQHWNAFDLATVPLPGRIPLPLNTTPLTLTGEAGKESLGEKHLKDAKTYKEEKQGFWHIEMESQDQEEISLAFQGERTAEHDQLTISSSSLYSEEESFHAPLSSFSLKGSGGEEEKEEPQTLAKKLLTKALGNVGKGESILLPVMGEKKSSTVEMPVSSSFGKVTFSMKPARVQKVSFALKSKKNMLKKSEDAHEDEEAKSGRDTNSAESAQPARFKKSMAELFRPDQDGPSEILKQQQLLQISQNALAQVLLQKHKTAETGNTEDKNKQQVTQQETAEAELNQKDEEKKPKERRLKEKSRRGSRWSQEVKDKIGMDTEVGNDQVVGEQTKDINREIQNKTSEEQLLNEEQNKTVTSSQASKKSVNDSKVAKPELCNLSEISELYRNILDKEESEIHVERLTQTVSEKTSVITNPSFEVKPTHERSEETVDESAGKQSYMATKREREDRENKKCTDIQSAKREKKMEEDRTGKETDEDSNRSGNKENMNKSSSNSKARNSGSSQKDSSRRRETRDRSQSAEKEKSSKRDEERDRRRNRSRSRDRGRGKRKEYRNRSESRDRDYRRRNRSRSRERNWRSRSSRSRSRDRYNRRRDDSHERDARRMQRSSSRERVRRQRQRECGASNEKRGKHRSRSLSHGREVRKEGRSLDEPRDKEKSKGKDNNLKDGCETVSKEKSRQVIEDRESESVHNKGSAIIQTRSIQRNDDRLNRDESSKESECESDFFDDRSPKKDDGVSLSKRDHVHIEEEKSHEKHKRVSRDRDAQANQKYRRSHTKHETDDSEVLSKRKDSLKSKPSTQDSEYVYSRKRTVSPERENRRWNSYDLDWDSGINRNTRSGVLSPDLKSHHNQYHSSSEDSLEEVNDQHCSKRKSSGLPSRQREIGGQEGKKGMIHHDSNDDMTKDHARSRDRKKLGKVHSSLKSMKGLKLKLKSRKTTKEVDDPMEDKGTKLPIPQETDLEEALLSDHDTRMPKMSRSSEKAEKPNKRDGHLGFGQKTESAYDVDREPENTEKLSRKHRSSKCADWQTEDGGESTVRKLSVQDSSCHRNEVSEGTHSKWDSVKTTSRAHFKRSDFEERDVESVEFSSDTEESKNVLRKSRTSGCEKNIETYSHEQDYSEDSTLRKPAGILNSGGRERILSASVKTDEFSEDRDGDGSVSIENEKKRFSSSDSQHKTRELKNVPANVQEFSREQCQQSSIENIRDTAHMNTNPEMKTCKIGQLISEHGKADELMKVEESRTTSSERTSDTSIPNVSHENLAQVESKSGIQSSHALHHNSIDSQYSEKHRASSVVSFSPISDSHQAVFHTKDDSQISTCKMEKKMIENYCDIGDAKLPLVLESAANNKSDPQTQDKKLTEADSDTFLSGKLSAVVSEKTVDTVSSVKTESQAQMTHAASSPRTRSGRFGTASWSSGSKRRERNFRPPIEMVMAVKSKSRSSPGKTSSSSVSKCNPASSTPAKSELSSSVSKSVKTSADTSVSTAFDLYSLQNVGSDSPRSFTPLSASSKISKIQVVGPKVASFKDCESAFEEESDPQETETSGATAMVGTVAVENEPIDAKQQAHRYVTSTESKKKTEDIQEMPDREKACAMELDRESCYRRDADSSRTEDEKTVNRLRSDRHKNYSKDKDRNEHDSHNQRWRDEEKSRKRLFNDDDKHRQKSEDDRQDNDQNCRRQKERERKLEKESGQRERQKGGQTDQEYEQERKQMGIFERRCRESDVEQRKGKRQKLDQDQEEKSGTGSQRQYTRSSSLDRGRHQGQSSDGHNIQERDRAFDLSPVSPDEISDEEGNQPDIWGNESHYQSNRQRGIDYHSGRGHIHDEIQNSDHPLYNRSDTSLHSCIDNDHGLHHSNREPSPRPIDSLPLAHRFGGSHSNSPTRWPGDADKCQNKALNREGNRQDKNRRRFQEGDQELDMPGRDRDGCWERYVDQHGGNRNSGYNHSRGHEQYRNSHSPDKGARPFTQDKSRSHSHDRDQEQYMNKGSIPGSDREHQKLEKISNSYGSGKVLEQHLGRSHSLDRETMQQRPKEGCQSLEREVSRWPASTGVTESAKIGLRIGEFVSVSSPSAAGTFHPNVCHYLHQTQPVDQASAQQSQQPTGQHFGQYNEGYAEPQAVWQTAASNQIDPATLQLLQQQYQAMGYTSDQALALATQYVASSLAQGHDTQFHQESVQHDSSSTPVEPSYQIPSYQGSVQQVQPHLGLTHAPQSASEYVHHQHASYGAEVYPSGYIPPQQSHIPYESLAEMEANLQAEMFPDPKEAALFGDLPMSKESLGNKPEEVVPNTDLSLRGECKEIEVEVSSVKTVITREISLETPTEDEPSFSFETSTQSDLEETRNTVGNDVQTAVMQQQDVSHEKEREDIVSSTNTTEAEDAGSKREQTDCSEQPTSKVRISWHHSNEAEAASYTPPTSAGVSCTAPSSAGQYLFQERTLPVKQESESKVQADELQEKESKSRLLSRKKLKLAVGNKRQLTAEAGESYPAFEKITENIHLSQRKRSKGMKRMQCDCTTSKVDRARKIPACGEDCLNRMLMIECSSRCPCLDYCTNKRFQKKQYVKTEPFFCGPDKGWGLKASEDVPQVGTFVMEFVGELLSYKEFMRRSRQYVKKGLKHHYFMGLNSDEVIDATLKGSSSRFFNHSCDPNCETQKWTVNGELRVGFFTKKPVQAEEELTFDYQSDFFWEPQKCYCGAETCRGYIGGQKTSPMKKRKSKYSEHRRAGLFEDEMLDADIESISHLENGMMLRDHVHELCRLMVRAQKMEHRLILLQIIQNTTDIRCLRLFLGYQGLPLLWSWMVDIGMKDSEDDRSLKIKILSVLKTLPISNRTILKESKIMAMVEKWGTLSEPPILPESEADFVSEPLPLPLPVPPDRPVVSILSLHKDSKAKKTVKKRVTFADEAVNSDSDVVSSTNNEICAENIVSQPDPVPYTAVDDTVSTSESVPSAVSSDSKGEGENPDKELDADSSAVHVGVKQESDNENREDRHALNAETNKLSGEKPDTVSAVMSDVYDTNPGVSDDITSKPESNQNSNREEADSTGFIKDAAVSDIQQTSDIEISAGVSHNTLDSKESFRLQKQDVDRHQQSMSDTVCGTSNTQEKILDRESLQSENCSSLSSEQAGASASQQSIEGGDDSEMPTLVNEAMYSEASRNAEEVDEIFLLAAELLAEWNELKELYKIPKKQKIEERKRTERELDSARPETNEPDPYAEWKRKKAENLKRREPEENELKNHYQEEPGTKLLKQKRRKLFEVQAKAERQCQQEALLQQQQKAAVALAAQQDPASSALLGLQQDPSLLASQGQMYDASLQQHGSILTAEQQQLLLLAAQAAGGDMALAAQQLMMHQGLYPQTQDQYHQQLQAAYASGHVYQEQIQQQHLLASQQLAMQQASAIAQAGQTSQPTQAIHPAQVAPKGEEEDVPPPPSPVEQDGDLPEHWKRARDAAGRVYYYHTLTRATQWDFPGKESSSPQTMDVDNTEPQEVETEEENRKKTTTAAADTSSEVAKKLKEQFRKQMSKFMVWCLNPYRKPDCKSGRIQSTEDFKHLARRLTHHVLAKELKHCRHIEDLEVNENVKAKTKDYVRKYMSRCGPVFKKSSSPDYDM